MAVLIQFFCKMYFLYTSLSRKKNLADFFGVLLPKKGPKIQASVPVDVFSRNRGGPPSISGKHIIGDGAWNFGPFLGGKTPKKSAKFFLRLRDAYKKYILQKKWIKTAISALSSGQSNLHPPIWGCHRQLDDHHRNPNSNDRDHLVGQLTRVEDNQQNNL